MADSSTPALAAAVSNAGGLGSLGCGSMSLDDIKGASNALRALTNRSFNLNFFAHAPARVNPEADAQAHALVSPFYDELGLGTAPSAGESSFHPFNAETLALVLEVKPAVASFHFGLPALEMVRALKEAGCRVLSSATNVSEARLLMAGGADAIIAQGWEAGGHQGSFDAAFEDAGVGTLALVPQVVDAVDVPVVAAGGIADARGIAAAFALGASGVQMGTAFLACPEAQVSDMHRAVLRRATDQDTRQTRAFSGRSARAKSNRYIEAMAKQRIPLPDFPTMYSFSDPLREHSVAREDLDFQFLLYGQSAAMARELPAAELMESLVEQARDLLGSK